MKKKATRAKLLKRKPEQTKRLRIDGRFASKEQLKHIQTHHFTPNKDDIVPQLYDNDSVHDEEHSMEQEMSGDDARDDDNEAMLT